MYLEVIILFVISKIKIQSVKIVTMQIVTRVYNGESAQVLERSEPRGGGGGGGGLTTYI